MLLLKAVVLALIALAVWGTLWLAFRYQRVRWIWRFVVILPLTGLTGLAGVFFCSIMPFSQMEGSSCPLVHLEDAKKDYGIWVCWTLDGLFRPRDLIFTVQRQDVLQEHVIGHAYWPRRDVWVDVDESNRTVTVLRNGIKLAVVSGWGNDDIESWRTYHDVKSCRYCREIVDRDRHARR